jgi:hypothetical protein
VDVEVGVPSPEDLTLLLGTCRVAGMGCRVVVTTLGNCPKPCIT